MKADTIRRGVPVAFVVIGFAVASCGVKATGGASASGSASSSASSGKDPWEGVSECDEYFKAVEECKADKVAPGAEKSTKDTVKDNMKASKDGWKAAKPSKDDIKKDCAKYRDDVKDWCTVGPEGVAECDEYFKAVEACKNPTAKKTQEENAKNFRQSWALMRSSDLKKTCKDSTEFLKDFCK
jgi:hypothetical protein